MTNGQAKTKLQTDKNGFIVGANRQEWKDASVDWHDTRRDVAVMRSIMERGAKSTVRHDTTQETAQAIGKAVAHAIAAQMGARGTTATAARRSVSGHTMARQVMQSIEHHAQTRDDHGRFTAKGVKSSHKKKHDKKKLGGDEAEDPGKGKHDKGLKEAAKALGEAGDYAAHVDPAVAAAKEVKEVVQPLGRGLSKLFGVGAEKKKEGWFKKIFSKLGDISKALKDGAAMRMPDAGGMIGKVVTFAAEAIASVLGGAVSMVTRIVGSLLGEIAAVAAPVLAVAFAAVAGSAIGTWIYDKWGLQIVDAMVATTDFLKKAWGTVTDAWNGITDKASMLIGDAVDFIKGASKKVGDIYDTVLAIAAAALAKLTGSKPAQILKQAYDGAVDATSRGIEGAAKGYNAVKQALGFSGGSNLTGMSDAQTRAYASDVARSESSGNARSENSYGFVGQYQFGADALADQGFIDKSKLAAAKKAAGKGWYSGGFHKAFVDDPNNWINEGGKQAFLSDKAMQDQAFTAYTNANIAAGMKSGALTASSTPAEIAAYAKASHLTGRGAANNWFLRGIDSSDAYGTSASGYATQGAAAIATLAPAVAAALSGDTPSAQAPTMANIPDGPKVARNSAPGVTNNRANISAGPPQDVGQNMRDRTIGHAATGGIGGG